MAVRAALLSVAATGQDVFAPKEQLQLGADLGVGEFACDLCEPRRIWDYSSQLCPKGTHIGVVSEQFCDDRLSHEGASLNASAIISMNPAQRAAAHSLAACLPLAGVPCMACVYLDNAEKEAKMEQSLLRVGSCGVCMWATSTICAPLKVYVVQAANFQTQTIMQYYGPQQLTEVDLESGQAEVLVTDSSPPSKRVQRPEWATGPDVDFQPNLGFLQ